MRHLEWKVHDDAKLVEVWLTGTEKNNPAIQAGLKERYAAYREKKYTVAVFMSGEGELYPSVRNLLVYNRKKCAELAVRQQPAAGSNRLPG